MVFGLFRRKRSSSVAPLYEALMQVARQPVFYAELGVADNVEGRLEMLMLFVGLTVNRLSADPDGREVARGLSELFIEDMERSMREIGYDDSGLKKRLKKVVAAFYGRAEATSVALVSEDPGVLVETLVRNVYGGAADPQKVEDLADHVRSFARHLADTRAADLAAISSSSLAALCISAGQSATSDAKS